MFVFGRIIFWYSWYILVFSPIFVNFEAWKFPQPHGHLFGAPSQGQIPRGWRTPGADKKQREMVYSLGTPARS
jgi:hypothetical protein